MSKFSLARVLLVVSVPLAGCLDTLPGIEDAGSPPDAGAAVDAGFADAGPTDAGLADAGDADAGVDSDAGLDAGADDAGLLDAGADAGASDAGDDAGSSDAGDDAGSSDAGGDAGVSDAGAASDAGTADGGPADAGGGVDASVPAVEWSPASINYGFVPPGLTKAQHVTFTNRAPVGDLTISQLSVSGSRYALDGGATLLVPAQSSRSVEVIFRPVTLGAASGSLTFTTSGTPGSGTVTLTGFGAGPDIATNPQAGAIDFGPLAAVVAGPPSSSARSIRISNEGTAPPGTGTAAHLRLGRDGGGSTAADFYEVVPLNADTTAAELSLTFGAYSAGTGLAPAQAIDAELRLTPDGPGTKSARVTVFSNDLDEPELSFVISAQVDAYDPCTYSLAPTALSFGVLESLSPVDLSFDVANTSADAGHLCLLRDVAIAGGSSEFEILSPRGAVTIAGGQSVPVTVRARATGFDGGVRVVDETVEGSISATPSTLAVSVSATVAQGCLLVSPPLVDFGTVPSGCSARTRTVTLRNTCGTSVSLTGVTLPAGDFAVQSGGTAGVIPAGQERVVVLGYSPGNPGPDRRNLSISYTQASGALTRTIPVHGAANAAGRAVETVSIPDPFAVDVLLVIDDSGSMATYQSALASSFTDFLGPAIDAGTDFHLGVITTDDLDPDFSGQLVTAVLSGSARPQDPFVPKVLTRNDPALQANFAAKVRVGTLGAAIEQTFGPATAAIRAPLVFSQNAGFLRDDTALAIVAVTDASEQTAALSARQALDTFRALAPRTEPWNFSFSAIAGFDPAGTCSYDNGPDDGGFAGLVAATHGAKGEICASPLSGPVATIAERIFQPARVYPLLGAADGGLVTVRVNGVVLDGGYRFDGGSVELERAHVAQGNVLSFEYEAACR